MPSFNDIDGKIQAVNERLRHANLRVTIRRLNKKLYLQGTFPPKPDSDKTKPHQQILALGITASLVGLITQKILVLQAFQTSK